jgi:hypothetical protein
MAVGSDHRLETQIVEHITAIRCFAELIAAFVRWRQRAAGRGEADE